jgi:uncharacterized surface protein with fasciclin (FAS1) repeats
MQTRVSLFIKAVIRYGGGCFLAFLFGLASCRKTPGAVPNPITPLQAHINSDSTLSYFHRLIIQANETGLLANNSVTLLIPTNTAFQAAGYSQAFIDSLRSSQADGLVRDLFIPAPVSIPVTDSTAYAPYTTLSGNPVYGMADGHGSVWFNGSRAIRDTAQTGQALVYRLGGILLPSSDSLNHLLDGDSTLSFLAEAFRRTHVYDTLLLSGGSYTILAPVNSAFQNAGYDSIPEIDSADLGALIRLVEYHTVNGIWFTNTLMAQNTLSTKEGGTISVSQPGGVFQFLGTNNTVPASLLTGNQVAGKTIVIQRISQLLLP